MRQLEPLLLAVFCLASALAGTQQARAADYPTRPVKIVVPYAPGGATDIVARVLADQLQQKLGQNFLVENKPGAFGILAIEELAKAKPDGYTLMIGNVSTNAITPVLFPKRLHVDYDKEIVPVTRLADLPEFLEVSTTLPVKTVAELIDYVKKNPGKVTYGSVGVGSYPQFDMITFARKAGLDMIHVPAKGGASDVLNSMATGDIKVAFLNVASSAGMIKAGRIRPLAVVAPKRLPDYPDVPTMDEIGYPGIGTTAWQALFARAGTPKEVLDIIYKATVQALESAPAKKVFEPAHMAVMPSGSPAQAAVWLREETERWRGIIKDANLRLD